MLRVNIRPNSAAVSVAGRQKGQTVPSLVSVVSSVTYCPVEVKVLTA